MATVKNFDRSMIKNYLTRKEYKFLVDSDGDFLIKFAYDPDYACQMSVYLIVTGSKQDVYSVRIMTDKRIPKSDWGKALMLCNTWNKERRWPTAYLKVNDPDRDPIGTIELNYNLDLEQGIHQELLDDFTSIIISTGDAFWTWAHKEQGL